MPQLGRICADVALLLLPARDTAIMPSTSNVTSWISVPSESRLPWALDRCSGWAWAGLGHPQGGGCEARAEATDHFRFSPTKRSTQNEVDLSGQFALAGS